MENTTKRIVIVGGGFAGINALKALKHVDAEVIVIDKRSSQNFQPLLFQVATCNISGEDVQSPIREFLKDHEHIQFIKDFVHKIDPKEKKVYTDTGWKISYDYLLLTAGSVINHYGMEDVSKNSFSMKSSRDALKLRTYILNELDAAANSASEDQDKHLTFVIAGGGATGVELAGSLLELVEDNWNLYYPRLRNKKPKVYLLEGAPSILTNLPEKEQKTAIRWLEDMNVKVCLNTQITGYDGNFVQIKDGEPIETKTLIWAAGVKVNPLVNDMGFEQGHAGRLVVEPTLQVKGDPTILAAGDTAHFEPKPGDRPLPMTAAVASQAGVTAGRNLKALCEGRPLEEFKYRDKGFIAIIGHGKAVGVVNGRTMSGFICWFIWAVLHIFLPYSKHVRWSLFWKFMWNAVTSSSPYRNTVE